MRISETQAGVLRRLADGVFLHHTFGAGGGVYSDAPKYSHWTVRTTTVRALRKRGLIGVFEDKSGSYPRRAYKITQAGHKALEEYDEKAN